ncbi:hypothetical protein AYI69_g3659, partial [Smittium culicis]
MKDPKNTG